METLLTVCLHGWIYLDSENNRCSNANAATQEYAFEECDGYSVYLRTQPDPHGQGDFDLTCEKDFPACQHENLEGAYVAAMAYADSLLAAHPVAEFDEY